jgi:hypothetical protein
MYRNDLRSGVFSPAEEEQTSFSRVGIDGERWNGMSACQLPEVRQAIPVADQR